MATYQQIQGYIKKHAGFSPQTCWIADVKERNGLQPPISHNRHDPNKRAKHCPIIV